MDLLSRRPRARFHAAAADTQRCARSLRRFSSLSFRAGILDDFFPALDFVKQEHAEFLRRVRGRIYAQIDEPFAHVIGFDSAHDFAIEPRDHGFRRAGWRGDAVPADGTETREA